MKTFFFYLISSGNLDVERREDLFLFGLQLDVEHCGPSPFQISGHVPGGETFSRCECFLPVDVVLSTV